MRTTSLLLASLLACGAAMAADAPADSVYTRAVADSGRPEKDRARDAREKPAEVLALAGFQPGMKVADIFAGGGYYSELVSDVVGPGGSVLLLNNTAYQQFAREQLKERLKDGRLTNVKEMLVESCNLRLGQGGLDGAMIVMSYHDLYHVDEQGGWAPINAGNFLDQIHAALKPGAVFLIVDHAAKSGSGKDAAQELHRIDEHFAKRDIESHGFRLEKSWDGLRNSADDHVKMVFDPSIRGKTDRFVHVYRRI
jgi:predicted methyltransferase